MTQISDEFLLAYLDGQLESAQAAGVGQLAKANVEISRRLQRLKQTQAQLMETFGAFIRDEVRLPDFGFAQDESANDASSLRASASLRSDARSEPNHLRAPGPSGSNPRQWLFVAAVFLGGLMGGYGATLLAAPGEAAPAKIMDRPREAVVSPADWASDITRFHAFFPRETLTPHPDAITNPELIRFQLTKVAAKALSPADFSRQGYTLFRGQVFNYNQERMMQLTFSSKTEPPVTLYVLPGTAGGDRPVSVQSLGSNKAVSWVSDKVRFLLTSDKSEEDLKILAMIAQSQMPRKN